MSTFISIIRIVIASMAICVIGYGSLILTLAQTITPHTANGSLIVKGDSIVGSRHVAQSFSAPGYFWPRPSAVDYNGAGAGGGNLAPTNVALAERAAPILEAYGATSERPIPADLVTASGSGLDPHISVLGARYQVPRIANSRGVDPVQIESLIDELAYVPGGLLTGAAIVNVLELNIALDNL